MFRRCGRPLGVSSRLQPLCGLRLRTALCSVCSPLQPFGPPMFASSLAALPASLGSSAAIAPSIRNGRPAAPYGLQYSLAHWAYYGLFRALRAAFVRPTGCAASFALIGVFVPACASLARYSGAAERFALSSPLHPFGASTTTACFRHWRRPSCAPFSFGKKEAFGRATSYDCATNQKAPLDSKGAHEARALCAEQREVSPVRQGASQASPASEEKRLCRTVECCRRQPTEGLPFTQEQLLSGAIPENSACSSVGVPGIEKPPANASKEEYHAYLVRLQEHFAREDAAAAAERARQAAEHVPERRVPEFVRERLKQLRAQAAARRARERAESEASYRKALAAWLGDASAEKAKRCA